MKEYPRAVFVMGIVLIATCLCGCATQKFGSKVSDAQKAAIEKGKTTKADVLISLGNPDQTIDLGSGKEELLYIRGSMLYGPYGNKMTNTVEYWIILDHGVVSDSGERPTTKQVNMLKPF